MISFSFLNKAGPKQINQILKLYHMAGWWPEAITDDQVQVSKIIAGSHCFLAAVHKTEIIGMGRVISDKISDAYIQDVTVRSDFRENNIGSKIVSLLAERLHQDGLSWIGLIAEKGSCSFYQRLGFEIMQEATPMLLKKMISKKEESK